ncbi:Aste57867_24842 [Aphanomyces stellatus]|uniref:Aste57867_24842 protein n=1 Tax=Aphanomyces stellatus TaxID=120398 RepID=A0A485LRK3_9STRA|nr:hypothetical protein As57867_024764 [Aphanomyces stellatus]VFU01476.1 Aste57867_24842 [Aphanomyces stellatus]
MADAAAWDAAVDPASNCVYYFNKRTGEASWTKPTPIAAAERIQAAFRGWRARAAVASLLQIHFERVLDPASQTYFYHNVRTGQSTWMTPRGLKTQKTTPTTPPVPSAALPPHWVKMLDEATQRVFYANPDTGETSWTVPELTIRDDEFEFEPSIITHRDEEVAWESEHQSAALMVQAAWRGTRARNQLRQELERVVDANGTAMLQHRGTKKRTTHRLPREPHRRHRFQSPSERSFQMSQRRFPRSKAQLIVDAAEDAELDDVAVLELELRDLGAARISSRVWNLEHLQRLVLSRNKLTRLPSAIQDLTALLDVSHNLLTTLPAGLQTTLTLLHVDASHNQIAAFSPRLWKLKSLVHLDLSFNALVQLPFVEGDLKLLKETGAWQVGIGLLTALTHLDLSHNGLTQCPTLLDKCAALKFVDLSYNEMEALDTEFGNLRALETCRVQHNRLVELPDSTGRMALLQTLDASHNCLETLPPSIGSLESLAHLDLASNHLTTLPITLKALTALRHLDITQNPNLVFPNLLHAMTKLELFAANQCSLPDLPPDVFLFHDDPSLCTLRVNHNQLTEVPIATERLCRTLQLLHLAHNAITSVPPRLYECTKLVELSLAHNCLMEIPAGIAVFQGTWCLLQACPDRVVDLTTLDISHNQLTAVPEDLVRLVRLRHLRMSHNRIRFLPGLFGLLMYLEHWDISHNRLECFPSTCHRLLRLKYVGAASNCLDRPPPFFRDNAGVFVDLSNNPFQTRETMYQAQLDAVAAAKRDLARRQYEPAAQVFTNLLFDVHLRPYRVLSQAHQQIRAQAFFFRGICRYQQIHQAMTTIEGLGNEAAPLERLLHEEALIDGAIAPVHSPEAVAAAQFRLDVIIAEKAQLRTSIVEWKEQAVVDLGKAIKYGVEPMTATYTLGCLYLKTNQLPEAIQTFGRTLEYFPEGATQGAVPVLLHRAEAYARLGQTPMAKDDLNLILGAFPDHETAATRLNMLDEHASKYHAGFDTASHKRSFVMEPNGTLHRLNDPVIAELEHLNELDTPAKFAAACDALREERARAAYLELAQRQEAKEVRRQKVEKVQERRREINENLSMEREEKNQHEREAEIEFARRRKALELQREANETQWMQYEESLQRWVESEQERFRLEEIARLEELRRKEEAKAEYKKRLARRGGLRQGGRARGRGR